MTGSSERLISEIWTLLWPTHTCAFCLNMAKSDHKENGITSGILRIAGFAANAGSVDSPGI